MGKMKMGRMRNSFFIVIVVFSAIVLAGCGGKDGSGSAEAQDEKEAQKNVAESGGQAETAEADGSKSGADTELVQQGGNKRPEKFPGDAVDMMSDYIATGEAKLSEELVEKVKTVYERAGEIEQGDQEALNELLDEIGFSGIQDFIEANTATLMAIDAVLSLGQVQEIIDSKPEEKKAAEDYQISEAVESITQQALAASKLTEKDLHFVYENWEMFEDVKRLAESGQ